MKRIVKVVRLFQISFILARYDIDKIACDMNIFFLLRFLLYLNPRNWGRIQHLPRAQAIRCALEELGPIFVKFGQAISTRRDLLAKDIADELALLQDRVAPFSGEQAKQIAEQAYGCPLDELFAYVDVKPLASASIAQVHDAELLDGDAVVIKILRPNIKKAINRDVSLLYTLAYWVETYWRDGKRLRPIEMVAEFEKTILDELNLMREAANASQLRRNFIDTGMLYVPKIYWDLTRDNVMVLERIHGIAISDIKSLHKHQVNIKKLAERGVEIFFTQVFRDSFFHADMHPGNIFVSYTNPDEPQYICVDFGIIGTLTESDKFYLAENLYAFFNRDYRRVAELHVASGWVPGDTRVDEFESAIRTVCEPIFERPLSEISCAQMLLQLFQTGRRFNMPAQPQLVLLQKTLFAIEGLGRELYPQLDLWSTAKPFLERWIKERYGPQSFMQQMQQHAPRFMHKMPELPGLLYDVLARAKEKQLLQSESFKPSEVSPKRRGSALGMAIVFFIAAGVVSCFDQQMAIKPFTVSPMSVSFALVGGLSLVWSFLKRIKISI